MKLILTKSNYTPFFLAVYLTSATYINQVTTFSYLVFMYGLFIFFVVLGIYKSIFNKNITINIHVTILSLICLSLINFLWNYEQSQKNSVYLIIQIVYFLSFYIFAYIVLNFSRDQKINFLFLILLLFIPFLLFFFYATFIFKINLDSRFDKYSHPNQIAEIIIFIGMLLVFLKNNILRIIFFLIVFFILYVLEARGSLTTLLIFLIFFYFKSIIKYKYLIMLCIALFSNFIVNEIFLIEDPYRGLGTGFTGRTQEWIEGLEFFLNNPFFGKGFYTTTIHNGYIKLLAENGIFMTLMILYILFKYTKIILNNSNDILIRYSFCYIIAYLFFLIFSPRYINLNILSLFFVFSLTNIIFRKNLISQKKKY